MWRSAMCRRLFDQLATPAQAAAGCRAYNRWLADFCARGDAKRHLGVARVSLADVDAIIEESESATILPSGYLLHVDRHHNLLIERQRAGN